MSTTMPAPPAHVAVALHAVTGHMVDNDLPLPNSLRVRRGDQIEVTLYERAFDTWAATLSRLDGADRPVDEVETDAPWDDLLQVHADGLTDSGVRVRLCSTRQVTIRRSPTHESDWSSETSPATPYAEAAMGAES